MIMSVSAVVRSDSGPARTSNEVSSGDPFDRLGREGPYVEVLLDQQLCRLAPSRGRRVFERCFAVSRDEQHQGALRRQQAHQTSGELGLHGIDHTDPQITLGEHDRSVGGDPVLLGQPRTAIGIHGAQVQQGLFLAVAPHEVGQARFLLGPLRVERDHLDRAVDHPEHPEGLWRQGTTIAARDVDAHLVARRRDCREHDQQAQQDRGHGEADTAARAHPATLRVWRQRRRPSEPIARCRKNTTAPTKNTVLDKRHSPWAKCPT